ncbi:CHRD domain-containing protein [Hymenobacter busanensis]|uniref:CHRD domain-containing protein n=1 Tax=Hymenobacter busanensis TaxID=2607656 RepID=A0A7L4ZUB7_9BACT|nr:CHRD domain-containing protein [Hymenobacter busanensis]KAA9339472.1 CHRD domain-containing protein [Hymenobacter busanensis]QHJ06771.1 CHRD domain-containing protein [Hymenobacter busanensis]
MTLFRTLLRAALLPALWLLAFSSRADHLHAHLLLGAQLTGAQEAPAVNTAARGVASFTFNENRDTLFVTAAFNGLSGPITNAHVHEGARGVSGPVITPLFQFVNGNRLQGFLTGADIDKAKISKYLRGEYYINVHTAANPAGEIRGQIEVETDVEYSANINGAQEVPAVNTQASGYGTFNLSQDQGTMKFRVVMSGLSGPATNAHFHTGAVGVSGPVIIGVFQFASGNLIEGEVATTPAFLTALASGQIYFNVHTAANPGGEIRGQVLPTIRAVAHDARLDGSQMVPAVTTPAKGVSVLRLNTTLDTLRLTVAHTGLSGAPTSLVLYAADAGVANSSANQIASVTIPAGTPNPFGVTFSNATPALVNLFLRGGVNMVLTTAANPNGELRGQVYRLAREGYTFALNGAQEAPNPTPSTGYGAGYVSIDRDQTNAHFAMTWGGLTATPTAGHFHTGRRGQAGPVIFNLLPYFAPAGSGISAEGYWRSTDAAAPFTLRRSLQFRQDSMYVNLHTPTYPGGEVRGQVFRGARNLRSVLAAQPAAVLAETFAAYPNPATNHVQLEFTSRVTASGTVQVFDPLGRKVLNESTQVQPGSNKITLDVSRLKSGIYFTVVSVSGTDIVGKFAKE